MMLCAQYCYSNLKISGLHLMFFSLSKEAKKLGRKTLQTSVYINSSNEHLCNSASKFFGIEIRWYIVALVNFPLSTPETQF